MPVRRGIRRGRLTKKELDAAIAVLVKNEIPPVMIGGVAHYQLRNGNCVNYVKVTGKRKLSPPPPKVTRDTWARFGLPAPNAEVRVCKDRLWRVDFFWPPEKLAVEIHGGMWCAGAHARSPKDFAKGHRVTLNRWWRMEFTVDQVTSGYAPEVVRAFLAGANYCGRKPVLPADPEDRRKGGR